MDWFSKEGEELVLRIDKIRFRRGKIKLGIYVTNPPTPLVVRGEL
jgi:hypothetical protein